MAWHGTAIRLFHGTSLTAAQAIMETGPDLRRASPRSDFGRGFYVTADHDQAILWARRRFTERAAIVTLLAGRRDLGALLSLHFTETPAGIFLDFVQYCRTGRFEKLGHAPPPAPSIVYDMVVGPYARRRAGRWELEPGTDQWSFHTESGLAKLRLDGIREVS